MAKKRTDRVEVEEDYTFASTIKPGSDEHAAMLGLVKAEPDYDLQCEGWKLADETAFGPYVNDRVLRAELRRLVSDLKAEIVLPQSEDPRKPNYAPPIWRPNEVTY